MQLELRVQIYSWTHCHRLPDFDPNLQCPQVDGGSFSLPFCTQRNSGPERFELHTPRSARPRPAPDHQGPTPEAALPTQLAPGLHGAPHLRLDREGPFDPNYTAPSTPEQLTRSHRMAFGAAVPMWATRRHYYLVPRSLPSSAPSPGPRPVPSTAGGGMILSTEVTKLEGHLSPPAAEFGPRLPGSHPLRSEVPTLSTLFNPCPHPRHSRSLLPTPLLPFLTLTSPALRTQPGFRQTPERQ